MTDRRAVVWAATWIPAPSPLEGFGAEGYAVCWADAEEGRLQLIVDGARPAPGAVGRIVRRSFGAMTVDVFVEEVS